MKMLCAGDASSLSPVLNLTSGIVSVLFGPSALVVRLSSNSEVVAQTMALDFVMFESCGLKGFLKVATWKVLQSVRLFSAPVKTRRQGKW